MGSLILPAGGSVYVDANVIIYSVERVEPYSGLLAPNVGRGQGRPVHSGKQRARRIGNLNL